MQRRFKTPSVLLAAILTLPLSSASTGEEQAKTAALEFGRALTRADTSAMRSVLPESGKIRLRLQLIAPEEGSYSPEQVQALFKDFLRQGEFNSFDLLRLQCASDQFGLVHSRVRLSDRNGRPAEIDLHLTFQPEGGRWVLREIRESPP